MCNFAAKWIKAIVRDTDVMRTQLLEAEIKGRKKGLAEGRAEGILAKARRMKEKGRSPWVFGGISRQLQFR